mmetsp:Transcript_39527/g.61632  ORF Transcript_39527/g.61632 Transcript_39527/m.61632 type:complete len:154 (+) Transcript_39527:754-1215(+)
METLLCGAGYDLSSLYQVHKEAEPVAQRRRSASPLDLFFYPNIDCSVRNLDPHLDPGYVTVVPRSQVPGLEVFGRKIGKWIQVENNRSVRDRDLFQQVVVFVGEEMQSITHGKYHAAVHRVARVTDKARLSMVFELRPPVNYVLQNRATETWR